MKLLNVNCLFMPLKPQVTQINVESTLCDMLWERGKRKGGERRKVTSKIHLGGAFYSSLADKPGEERLITRLVAISTYLSILCNRAVCSAWKLLIK